MGESKVEEGDGLKHPLKQKEAYERVSHIKEFGL